MPKLVSGRTASSQAQWANLDLLAILLYPGSFFFTFVLSHLGFSLYLLRILSFPFLFSQVGKERKLRPLFYRKLQYGSPLEFLYACINSEYFRCFSIKICTQITISKTFIVNLNQIYYKKSHNWHTFVPVRQ